MRQVNICHQRLRQFARGLRRAPLRLFKKFGRDQRGATALFIGFAIIPLVAFTGLAVDTTRSYLVKARLNQAIDAAVLAGGRVYASPTRDDDIRMFFKANFPDGYMNTVTTPLVIVANTEERTLNVTAHATLPTTFMRLVNIHSIEVGSTAGVTIAAQNVEVALVLDITGSMAGQDIIDLRAAANELVDIVVQDQQTPFYTKVALAPYSQAINVGAYAPDVRGAIALSVPITGATKANPLVVTAPNHGFTVNDKLFIGGVSGMTEINNNMSQTDHTATKPQFWVINSVPTPDTFTLKRLGSSSPVNSTSWNPYTSGGSLYCVLVGCQYQAFQNSSNNHEWRVYQVSTCVTERVGVNAYTDVSPKDAFGSITAPVGPNYPVNSGSCLTTQITPLSSDKTMLHTKINALTASGTTAGHIGTAWGWYLLSPNFGYLWPNASQKPAAYGTEKLLKVAVIMTDGDFNTVYYNGVLADDATTGSNEDQVDHNSVNGNPYTQAQALCSAMKAPGTSIEIYTVGLGLSGIPAAEAFLTQCATSAAHVYLPASGAAMKDAFKDIAMKISRLRISK